jgi:Zn-dependent protease
LEKYQQFLLVVPILLFSMVAHEYAHGYAALRQGDNTALMLGRLTWNPLKHIDPVMTILMPLVTFFFAGVAFGGAKPVPVNPRLYRDYRRGDIIVSLAGVATNCAIAVLLIPLVMALGMLGRALPSIGTSLALLQTMFVYGVVINLALAAFNLIPIPPLDGSVLFERLLPRRYWPTYLRIRPYTMMIVVGLVLLNFLFNPGPITIAFQHLYNWWAGVLFGG